MDDVVHHCIEHGVATITLDSPHNRNALSRQLINELHAGIDAAEAAEARVIVLRHTGNTFCAGADLSRGPDAFDHGSRPIGEHRDEGGLVTLRMFDCLKPIACAQTLYLPSGSGGK